VITSYICLDWLINDCEGFYILLLYCIEALREEGVFNVIAQRQESQQSSAIQTSETENVYAPFHYSGRFHRLPSNFSLPKGGVLAAWQLWLCGDRRKNIVPLACLGTKDMPTRNMAKRFSDLALLCRTIQKICVIRGGMILQPNERSVEDAFRLYAFALIHLPCREEISPNGQARRPLQVTWKTMVKYIQQSRKLPEYSDIFPL
jgi:hypothetical protein